MTPPRPPPGPAPGDPPRPRLAVSSCLLDAPARRDGFLTGPLAGYVDWVPIGPEIEIGLGAPRPSLQLLSDGRIVTKDRTCDHTGAMTGLANDRLPDLADIDGYVIKSRLPSCGLPNVPRYASGRPGGRAEGQPVDRRGPGVFAALVTDALPHLPIEEDGRLHDPVLREHFVERVFAHARLRGLFTADWHPRDLVAFHSRHKLQILAHDPAAYRNLGRIVAQAGTRTCQELENDYRRAFSEAFAVRPERGRHANALLHVFSLLSAHLDPTRRRDVLAAIESYQRGEAPLTVPIALLRHHAEGEHLAYLAQQTYLDPYPADLLLRDHI